MTVKGGGRMPPKDLDEVDVNALEKTGRFSNVDADEAEIVTSTESIGDIDEYRLEN